QVYRWVHKKLTFDFALMSDLPQPLRDRLKEEFSITAPEQTKVLNSRDGTKKYLFTLADGNRIESVLLKDKTGRKTICVSTQAGCPLGCAFCATGESGFSRSLEVSEILGQVYRIALNHPEVSNLVFMGMGEPFLNYDNVIKSIRILISAEGANFGQRKITVSTCGIPDGIKKFAREGLQVRLAISLNSADDRIRSQIMPINDTFPLRRVAEAIRYYIAHTKRRVTLEYILLEGVNDRRSDAEKLIEFAKQFDSENINLIPFNPTGGAFKPSTLKTAKFFYNILTQHHIVATIRQSKGGDILAACGQLAGKK
ncbi:MAG TPA: 23S rRNA (adenine(2503)-C(2))-methyltransferase RlmN, partial [Candidatus Omnitrophota bacterium]|nr:23S rRNA (adenine(2503)-C(2))-methyltransferase RlmN [Candidatus Omnitrophota bacterium]